MINYVDNIKLRVKCDNQYYFVVEKSSLWYIFTQFLFIQYLLEENKFICF